MSETNQNKTLYGFKIKRTTTTEHDEEKETAKGIFYTMAKSEKQAINNLRHKYKLYNYSGLNVRITYNFIRVE